MDIEDMIKNGSIVTVEAVEAEVDPDEATQFDTAVSILYEAGEVLRDVQAGRTPRSYQVDVLLFAIAELLDQVEMEEEE